MLSRTALLLLLLSIPFSRALAFDCPNPTPTFFNSVASETEQGCRAAQYFAEHIVYLNRFLKLPPVLNLQIETHQSEKGDRFNASHDQVIIYAPFGQTGLPAGTGMSAIWLHEYGHAVCSLELEKKYSHYGFILQKERQIPINAQQVSGELQGLEKELETLQGKNSLTPTEQKKLEGINAKNKLISERASAFLIEQKKYHHLYTYLEPYAELCADVVSVLALQNPHAVTDAITQLYGSQGGKELLRDFSIAHAAEDGNACKIDSHSLLSPVRSELNVEGLTSLSTDRQKRLFFQRFIRILAVNFDTNLKTLAATPAKKTRLLLLRLERCHYRNDSTL